MSWTDGVDRATGDLVTAAQWNALLGAAGSMMFLKTHGHSSATGDGGTSLGALVKADFTDAAAPAAPGAGVTRLYTTSKRVRYQTSVGTDLALIGGAFEVMTDGATITPNQDKGPKHQVTLTASGHNFALPSNVQDGDPVIIKIIQDGTGSRTATFDAGYKFPGAVTPTLTTTAGAKDYIGGIWDAAASHVKVLAVTLNVA